MEPAQLSSSHKDHAYQGQAPELPLPAFQWPFKKKAMPSYHFVSESSKFAEHPLDFKSSMYSQAAPAARTRHVEVPLHTWATLKSSFIREQPVSSIAGLAAPDGAAASILNDAGNSISAGFAASNHLTHRSYALSADSFAKMPNPYLTTQHQTLPQHPSAANYQHLIRTPTTSYFLCGLPDRLNSAPLRVATAPTSSRLLSTSFLALRDPDGTRRVVHASPSGTTDTYPPAPLVATPLLRQPQAKKCIGAWQSETASSFWSEPPKKNDLLHPYA